MLDEKQLFQIQNILETLVEATDHFASLIKEKELNQSIYIFSSIVEGSQAVINLLHSQNQTFTNETKNLEEYLFLIADELENGRLIKVAEVIQFSLRPLLVRLQKEFVEELGDQKAEDIISIGIFNSWVNPKDTLREERMQAILNEGIKQNTTLYFFTSTDVDFEKEQIHANTFRNEQWERVTVPFPDVINNIGAGKRSQTERKLQRIIPFTTFHVGNKFTLPERMLKHRKFAELLVPFTVCMNEDNVYNFIEKNNQFVFKALASNRGENIYFVTKKGSRYILFEHKKERILTEEEFEYFIKYTILAEKGSFIIQRYILSRTKSDEPFHIRAQVQKNGDGKWILPFIYAVRGEKKGFISNRALGHLGENLDEFMINEFHTLGEKYANDVKELSVSVAKHLDSLYGFGLAELGIDFAIDKSGKLWMHEANNGPATRSFEDKRAVHIIAYAKYIAKNGIIYIDQHSIDAAAKGQFQAKNSHLPLFKYKNRTCIGMLIGHQTNDNLSIALATVAKEKAVPFYAFTPIDIDYDLGLIRGSFYEDGEWIQKVVEFPSVIIDRLKMRSYTEPRLIYEELHNIPFTNDWVSDALSCSAIYKSIQKNEEIARLLAAYQTVERPLHVFQFIEEYGQVQLKQEDMAYKNPIYTIRATHDKQYEIIQGSSIKEYSENGLRNYINHLIDENNYIVQQHSEASEIQSLLMKNENNEWVTVYNYVELKTMEENNTINFSKHTLAEFLTDNQMTGNIEEQIETLSINVLVELEYQWNKNLSEVVLTYRIDSNGSLSLTDVNPSGPRKAFNMEAYTEAHINYALSRCSNNN